MSKPTRPQVLDHKVVYFLRCLEHRTFTEAAASLGITHSALSLAISRLEKELGYALFKRSKRGIEPTPRGVTFSGVLLRFSRELDLNPSEEGTAYKVGVTVPFGLHEFLPMFLQAKSSLPKMQLFFTWSLESLEAVRARKLDLAFVGWTNRPRGVAYRLLRRERTGIIGLKSKYPALAKARSLKEVAHLPWVTHSMPQESWTELVSPTSEGFVIRDLAALRHLILSGTCIGEAQLSNFSREEMRKLVVAKIPPRFPGGGIYAVYAEDARNDVLQLVDLLFRALQKRKEPKHVLPRIDV